MPACWRTRCTRSPATSSGRISQGRLGLISQGRLMIDPPGTWQRYLTYIWRCQLGRRTYILREGSAMHYRCCSGKAIVADSLAWPCRG
eukprot:4409682-Lingulodinium_polyedra.AAC.1